MHLITFLKEGTYAQCLWLSGKDAILVVVFR
jgi:hypothetical protein